MLAPTDRYPSRGGRQPALMPRQDPTVYGSVERCAAAGLSADQHASFERNGFLILPDVFSPDEVACFQQESARLRGDPALQASGEVITEPGSGDIRSVFQVHGLSPMFARMASDARLAGLASALLDDSVYVHQSRLNYKPGYRGKEFYWHSDFETWHVEDGMPLMRALSMSITLTENTADNGPLLLIPGSHRKYVVCQGDTPEKHFERSLKKQEYGVPDDDSLAQLVREGGIVSAVGRPGSVVVFDCNVMHGSNSNITPHPRSNVFMVFNALANAVVDPFCPQPPRPEYICGRQRIEPLVPQPAALADYRRLLQA